MSQQVEFAETTVDKIIRFLKDWDNARQFKQFYYGDPGEIPINMQPCVVVNKLSTDIVMGPTGMDKVTEQIDVAVVANKTDYMGEFSSDDSVVDWQKKLELLMEGNDPATGYYDQTTIIGTLRQNLTLNNYAIKQSVRIRYGQVPRNGADNDTTGEAHAIFTIDHLQITLSKT